MTKAEIETLVAESVKKALDEAQTPATETPAAETDAPITAESVEKMVEAAIEKALAPKQEEKQLTADEVNDIVEKAVKKAVEPILKSRALPTSLGGENTDPVEKSGNDHYLHGIL